MRVKEDWQDWFDVVSRRARRDRIWDYCDPDVDEASLEQLVEPRRPTPSIIRVEATALHQLDDSQLKRWSILKEDYNDRNREYT